MAGLALVTGLLGSPRPAVAAAPESATISVLLLNHAKVAPDTLMRARADATRIYRGLGISLAWTDADEAVDYRFTVKVVAHEIGHLLLPYDSHARSGLMQGGWDQKQARRAEMGLVTFTSDEAALIRRRLETVNATAARR